MTRSSLALSSWHRSAWRSLAHQRPQAPTRQMRSSSKPQVPRPLRPCPSAVGPLEPQQGLKWPAFSTPRRFPHRERLWSGFRALHSHRESHVVGLRVHPDAFKSFQELQRLAACPAARHLLTPRDVVVTFHSLPRSLHRLHITFKIFKDSLSLYEASKTLRQELVALPLPNGDLKEAPQSTLDPETPAISSQVSFNLASLRQFKGPRFTHTPPTSSRPSMTSQSK